MRRVHQRAEPIPLKMWSISNLVSDALEPLQSEESLKAESDPEQENKREDTQARNCQSAEENVPSQWIGTLFQRAATVRKARILEMTLLLQQVHRYTPPLTTQMQP